MRLKQYLKEGKDSKEILAILYEDCFPFLKEIKGTDEFLYRGVSLSVSDILKRTTRLEDRRPKDTPEWMHEVLNNAFESKFGWPARNGVFATSDIDDAEKYGTAYLFFPIGKYEYVWSPTVEDLTVELGSLANEEAWDELVHDNIDPRDYEREYGPGSDNGYWINIETQEKVDPEDEPTEWKKKGNDEWVSSDLKYEFLPDLDYSSWYGERMEEEREALYDEAVNTALHLVHTCKNKDLKRAIDKRHEISFKCNSYYIVNRLYEDDIWDMLENSTFSSPDPNQLEFSFMKEKKRKR